MPATSTIPLDDLPGAPEHADALFAFSVHGLGGSKIAANKSLRGMMASEVSPPQQQQQQQQKEAPKKGWLSSLNTAVVGERQEVVTLMLTVSASEETSTTPAPGGGGMPGMPAPPALARRSTGDRPPSGVPARSAMLLAGGRPTTPTVFYQSEHRTFGQQPVSPAAVSRSTSPLGFPDGGGEGRMEGGKQRPMTMSEEGIVHFSIPARVPGNRSPGTNGGGDGEGEEETTAVFVVELWQVVNRSRRALWGSLTLTWDNLMAVPASPRKCGVFSGLQSERYPSAFLAVRRVCPPLPRPLSMSPRGVSNPAVEKFNPMVTFFTAIRQLVNGVRGGVGAGGVPGACCGGNVYLQGECIPLQFLFPVHNSVKHAALAWRARARKERNRQGLFSTDEEAFAHGMVVVHVSVSRARGLGPIAAAAAAAAATAGAPQSAQLVGGGADAGGRATSNNQGQSSLVRKASFGARGGRGGLPATGGGRGGLGGLGIEGAKVSSSMKAFGGRMKGMGVKAVAMARIASQASPAAHLRLGAVSSEEKILRQVV
ncbi:unnamed protein product [Ectocarpus sp. CCAP 1310/34]|nr:unnamed protein product [Ectocarpus sp. CCAP 1310/34]